MVASSISTSPRELYRGVLHGTHQAAADLARLGINYRSRPIRYPDRNVSTYLSACRQYPMPHSPGARSSQYGFAMQEEATSDQVGA